MTYFCPALDLFIFYIHLHIKHVNTLVSHENKTLETGFCNMNFKSKMLKKKTVYGILKSLTPLTLTDYCRPPCVDPTLTPWGRPRGTFDAWRRLPPPADSPAADYAHGNFSSPVPVWKVQDLSLYSEMEGRKTAIGLQCYNKITCNNSFTPGMERSKFNRAGLVFMF